LFLLADKVATATIYNVSAILKKYPQLDSEQYSLSVAAAGHRIKKYRMMDVNSRSFQIIHILNTKSIFKKIF
jgi:hypothetical protein